MITSEEIKQFLKLESEIEKRAMELLHWYNTNVKKLYKHDVIIFFDRIEDNLIFYDEYQGYGNSNYFSLPLKYIWMTEEEILKENIV